MCTVEVDERRSPERALHFVKLAAEDLRNPRGATLVSPILKDAYNDQRRDIFESMEDIVSLTGGRGAALAEHAHRTGSATLARNRLTWLDRMSPEGVSGTMRKYLTAERMTAVVLEPSPGAKVSTSEAHLLSAPRGPRVNPGTVDAAKLARVALPDMSAKVEKQLPNGLRVVVVPHGAAPRVRTGLVLRGGEWSAPQAGLDTLTWRLAEYLRAGPRSRCARPRGPSSAPGTRPATASASSSR